jgi:rhamnose transport system permease protein
MVITLGTLYAYRGINVLWTGSDQVHPSDLPKDFLRLGTQQILTIPVLSIVAIIVLALAGLAGVFYVTRYGSVSSQVGSGWELDAVGAAVIGGIAITGGVGSVWGAAIGAMLLMTINRALPILGIPDFWQRAVVGVLIIGAIVLDRVLAVRQRRQLIEARDES